MTKKKLFIIFAIAVFLGGLLSTRASASVVSLELPIEADNGIYGNEGERINVIDIATPESLVGLQCALRYGDENNVSVHPETHIEATSANVVRLEGTEDSAGKITTGDDLLSLNDRIIVDVIIGPDEVASLDGGISLTCSPPSTTTTSTTVPDTTTTTTTVPEVTTTSTTTVPEIPQITTSTTTTTEPTITTTTTIPLPPCLNPGEDDPRGPQIITPGEIPVQRQSIPICSDPNVTG
jgi:hypothetical protein